MGEDIDGCVVEVPLCEWQEHKDCCGAGEFCDFEITEQGFSEEGSSDDAEGCHGGDGGERGGTEPCPDLRGFFDEMPQGLQGRLPS